MIGEEEHDGGDLAMNSVKWLYTINGISHIPCKLKIGQTVMDIEDKDLDKGTELSTEI